MLSPTTVLKKATGVADRALSALHPLDAQCIEPRLYLTAYPTANDPNVLSRLGVTHVVSLLGHDITLPEFIKNENKLHIKIHDIGVVDLLGKFEKTTDFIRSALEENSTNVVLVHCLGGISRSPAVICAYLIATKGMNVGEAIRHVQRKRVVACPNPGFILQLEMYAARFESTRNGRIVSKVKELRARIA